MEPFYYTKMTKQQQAAYHVIMQGANALADEFQITAHRKCGAL